MKKFFRWGSKYSLVLIFHAFNIDCTRICITSPRQQLNHYFVQWQEAKDIIYKTYNQSHIHFPEARKGPHKCGIYISPNFRWLDCVCHLTCVRKCDTETTLYFNPYKTLIPFFSPIIYLDILSKILTLWCKITKFIPKSNFQHETMISSSIGLQCIASNKPNQTQKHIPYLLHLWVSWPP